MTATKQEWIDLWKILGEDFFIDMDGDHPCCCDDEDLPESFSVDGVWVMREDSKKPLTPEQAAIIKESNSAAAVMRRFRKTRTHESIVITFNKTDREKILAAIVAAGAKIEKYKRYAARPVEVQRLQNPE
jgi:hypothetical protein